MSSAHAIQSFDRLIATHENGDLNNDMSRMLDDIMTRLADQVLEHGGTQTAKISVVVNIAMTSDQVFVDAKPDFSISKPPRRKLVYFATSNNRLSRIDERQLEMGLRSVTTHDAVRHASGDE